MKKTQFKDAIRNIRKRIVSYLSLCLVVMLGLGGMFTTSYMGAGLSEKTDEYYKNHNFKDFEMISSVGISKANIDKIRAIDGVTAAEGVIQTDGSLVAGDAKSKVTVVSLTREVSVPDLTDGTYPTKRDECMIAEDFAETAGIRVGDKVKLSLAGLDMAMSDSTEPDFSEIKSSSIDEGNSEAKEESGERPLYNKEFTVTGLGHHPDFLRRMSTNVVILPLSAYNDEATRGLFTSVFIRTALADGADIFTDEYFDKVAGLKGTLEEMTGELSEDRANEMKKEANDKIDEEWAKAEAELEKAQGEIDSGEAELAAQLARGSQKLNEAQEQLEKEQEKAYEKKAEIEKKIAEYESLAEYGRNLLAEKKNEYKATQEKLNKIMKEYAEKKTLVEDTIRKFGGKQKMDELYDFAVDVKNKVADIDKLIQDNADPQDIDNAIKELGQLLENKKDIIRKASDIIGDPDVQKLLEKIQDYTGVEIMDLVETLNAIGYDGFMDAVQGMVDGTLTYESVRDTINDAMNSITEVIDAVREGENKLAATEKEIANIEKKLKEDEQLIANLESYLSKGIKELNKLKAELEDGKQLAESMKAEAEGQIAAGWNTYYAEKRKYEAKLEEAKALLAENRELAEKKLDEARAEVDNIECTWIVLDRRANSGYVDISSNLSGVNMMAVVFGMLFLIITAVVCFSTLAIIIDEQKTLVGTAKAFGFTKTEVAKKYLMFGVSAAVIGSILSVIGAYLLANFIHKMYANTGMYPFGAARSIITVRITVIACLMITAVTVIASLIACTDILRSPASVLMKGTVIRKSDNKPKKTKKVSHKGSLYSRLIIRNMKDDKARVLVTIAIIAFSCLLIGLGASMRLAFDGMIEKQMHDVNKYDMSVTMSNDISDKDKEAITSVLDDAKVSYLPVDFEGKLYRWNGRIDGFQMICADPDKLGDYYGVVDPVTGEEMTFPDDGILIQKRMHESFDMNTGDALPMLDNGLVEHEATVKGYFANYIGRTIVLSPAAYRNIFGAEYEPNSFFINLNGMDAEQLKDKLLAVNGDLSFESEDDFLKPFESASHLYELLVYITTGIAIMISFMILTNLSNIYLNRKKTELSVMRINGFSIRQTRGYLARETIFTTAAGIALGVIVGAIITPPLIAKIQQPDLEFIKSFQVQAWALAVGLETLFSIVINAIVFRKIKDLNFRDIT